MLRPSLTTAAAMLLGASVLAQGDLRSNLRPVTGPIKHAGVYHIDTGTWTRGANLANVGTPELIYNNSCFVPYYTSMVLGEKLQHGARLPSPSGPNTASVFYPSTRKDEAAGCSTAYTISGFEFLYCSSAPVTLNWLHQFQSSWNRNLCTTTDMTPQYTFDLTGLPGGTPTGSQLCWIIDIPTTSSPFILTADGDGTWISPSTMNQFGWSFQLNSTTGAGTTGPLIAGNFTWTGGGFTGPLTPCAGTDGTVWDCPINLDEEGTGMSSNDAFRDTGTSISAPSGPGCYYFGGTTIHSDFYLKLFRDRGCHGACSPMTSTCLPGTGGIIPCPCTNPPIAPNLGCSNFGPNPVPLVPGGATLSATGTASLSADSVQFQSVNENATATSILLQGTTSLAAGAPYAAGVRCPAGVLKRLYAGSASSGSIAAPTGAQPSVHVRSATLGNTILAGQSRHYMYYYRDPSAAGPCGVAASTYNSTQTGAVVWSM